MTQPEEADLSAHEVRPVDRARIARWLADAKMRYFSYHDGPVGGIWSGSLFTFGIAGRGTVLQIRGQYNRVIAIERREEILAALNERHARSAWPKAFLIVLDDGTMRVVADHSVSIAHGLSGAQLDRAIKVSLASVLELFAELDTRYPDPLATARESLA